MKILDFFRKLYKKEPQTEVPFAFNCPDQYSYFKKR